MMAPQKRDGAWDARSFLGLFSPLRFWHGMCVVFSREQRISVICQTMASGPKIHQELQS